MWWIFNIYSTAKNNNKLLATNPFKALSFLSSPLQKMTKQLEAAELHLFNISQGTLDTDLINIAVRMNGDTLSKIWVQNRNYGDKLTNLSTASTSALGGIHRIMTNLEQQIPSMFEALNGTAEKLCLLIGTLGEAVQNQFQLLGGGMTASIDVFAQGLKEQNSHLKDIKKLLKLRILNICPQNLHLTASIFINSAHNGHFFSVFFIFFFLSFYGF